MLCRVLDPTLRPATQLTSQGLLLPKAYPSLPTPRSGMASKALGPTPYLATHHPSLPKAQLGLTPANPLGVVSKVLAPTPYPPRHLRSLPKAQQHVSLLGMAFRAVDHIPYPAIHFTDRSHSLPKAHLPVSLLGMLYRVLDPTDRSHSLPKAQLPVSLLGMLCTVLDPTLHPTLHPTDRSHSLPKAHLPVSLLGMLYRVLDPTLHPALHPTDRSHSLPKDQLPVSLLGMLFRVLDPTLHPTLHRTDRSHSLPKVQPAPRPLSFRGTSTRAIQVIPCPTPQRTHQNLLQVKAGMSPLSPGDTSSRRPHPASPAMSVVETTRCCFESATRLKHDRGRPEEGSREVQ
ncbi:hypothetical protein BaRGS_00032547 [Batillaria attramentaria]|uniref:Uncharacterized protein n=1 Tax=Batillaria attramentaria TaxID=370345 RepID=A0ABD0JN39_9CAEN